MVCEQKSQQNCKRSTGSSQLPETAAPEPPSSLSYDRALHRRRPAAHSSDAALTCFFSYLEKFVVTLGRHQEASILKLHLPVLQQVVQNRQDVPLRLFQAFQDECSTFCGCTNCTLFPRDKSNIRHSAAWPDCTCSVMQMKLGLLIMGTRSPKSWAPDLGFAYSTNRILTKWFFSLEACFPICKMKRLEAVVPKAPFSCNILDISPMKQKTKSYFWISNAIKEADSLTRNKKWRLQSALSRFLWRSDKLGENTQRL